MVTRKPYRKSFHEGTKNLPEKNVQENSKKMLSEMVDAITVHQAKNSLKFILHVTFLSKYYYQIFKIIAVPMTGKDSELFEIDSYKGINKFFYFTTKDKLVYCKI